MTVEDLAARFLGLPAGSPVNLEPVTAAGSICRLAGTGAGGPSLLLRSYGDVDSAENNAAVLEAAGRLGFTGAPALLGYAEGVAVETPPEGPAAIAIVLDPADTRAVIRLLATFHDLPLREGLRWDLGPRDLVPDDDPPLFRLGFTADERAAAADPIREIRDMVRRSPLGPVHGEAVSANVFAGAGQPPRLTDFARAGYGVQAWDVAAFLLTAGVSAGERRTAAEIYGRERSLPADETADLVDAAGLLWGLDYLMELPRREITAMGDDPRLGWIRLLARRAGTGLREPAGAHPAATALRAALWPG